jgi:hypothetical protein
MFYVVNPNGHTGDFLGRVMGDSHQTLRGAIEACTAVIDAGLRLRLPPMFAQIAESAANLGDASNLQSVNVLRLSIMTASRFRLRLRRSLAFHARPNECVDKG